MHGEECLLSENWGSIIEPNALNPASQEKTSTKIHLRRAPFLRQFPANAIIDTVGGLTTDMPRDNWRSVAVCSDGSYGVEKDLISSFPIRTNGGKWEIVQKVPINDFSRSKIDASVAELKEEKSLVGDLLA
jgi:hypothetical protein